MNQVNALNNRQQANAQNPHAMLNHLCSLSQSLLDIADQETQAIVQNDFLSFAVLQDEKESLSNNYLDAAKSFRENINLFRRIDKSIIARLEKIQDELSTRTTDNNVMINQIQKQAENAATIGMKTALEYGTSQRADFTGAKQQTTHETATENGAK